MFFAEFACYSSVLIFTALRDVKTHLIPRSVHLILIAVGVVRILSTGPPGQIVNNLLCATLGLTLGGVPLFIIALINFGVGGGDVKLGASAGFALSQPGFSILVPGAYWTTIGALVLFLAVATIKKIRKKSGYNVPMPFAPFLAITGIGTFLCQIIWIWRFT